jgi:hypothetical protein
MELAKLYRDSEVGGCVLKSHFGSTYVQTELTSHYVPDAPIYPSLTLNTFVGGFNPSAVTLALEQDISVIWLPTFTAANHETDREFPFPRTLTATDERGELKPEVDNILELISDADRTVTLGNGHLGPDETRAVFDRITGADLDINFMLTHPDSYDYFTIDDQVEFAERGAYIEKCYRSVTTDRVSIEAMAESIRAIGASRCLLSTDHGQPDYASPPQALQDFIASLGDNEISSEMIATMSRDVPAKLLAAE